MSSHFSQLIARTIDRVSIAGTNAVAAEQLDQIQATTSVPVQAAVMVAGFMPPDGASTDEIGLVLRYLSTEVVQGLTGQLFQAGLLQPTDGGVTYTEEGRRCAQAVVDQQPEALDAMWAVDGGRLSTLHRVLALAAEAAVATGRPSPVLYTKPLQPVAANVAYELWNSITILRRFRADCHAQAWAEAGHTAMSIQGLGNGPERDAIEVRTNDLNTPIWASLSEQDQLTVLSGLGGLNGSGTPT
jgi:hypothetical protein